MNSEQIFAMGLGLISPWKLEKLTFKETPGGRELHIEIDFERGATFLDDSGKACKAHDTVEKTWRHLDFFQHKCYLHCRAPRIKNSEGKVVLVETPWARKESGFSLLFEAYALKLIEGEMPVNKVAILLREYAKRIWTIFNYWIKRAYESTPLGEIKQLGVDETSQKKGHNYITTAIDLEARKVIHVVEGKDAKTLENIANYMISKGVDPDTVEHASIDLSPAFIKGLRDSFPKAEVHFDRFHVKKLLNEAMDEVRRVERREHEELKGHKYTFLKNRNTLSTEKEEALAKLIILYPTLGEAYRLKTLFDEVWTMPSEDAAQLFLESWIDEVNEKKINPLMKFAKTVMAHKTGIINFVKTRITNGIVEGINSKIQLAKRRARGYRNTDNFINMIYFLCGKLNFIYPLKTT